MSSSPAPSDRHTHAAAHTAPPDRIFEDGELEQRRRDMLGWTEPSAVSPVSDVRTCLACGQREVVAHGGGFKCRACGAEDTAAQPRDMSTLGLLWAVRLYITNCSMPRQGPISGSLRWATYKDALAALDEVGEREASRV